MRNPSRVCLSSREEKEGHSSSQNEVYLFLPCGCRQPSSYRGAAPKEEKAVSIHFPERREGVHRLGERRPVRPVDQTCPIVSAL